MSGCPKCGASVVLVNGATELYRKCTKCSWKEVIRKHKKK